VMKT